MWRSCFSWMAPLHKHNEQIICTQLGICRTYYLQSSNCCHESHHEILLKSLDGSMFFTSPLLGVWHPQAVLQPFAVAHGSITDQIHGLFRSSRSRSLKDILKLCSTTAVSAFHSHKKGYLNIVFIYHLFVSDHQKHVSYSYAVLHNWSADSEDTPAVDEKTVSDGGTLSIFDEGLRTECDHSRRKCQPRCDFNGRLSQANHKTLPLFCYKVFFLEDRRRSGSLMSSSFSWLRSPIV